MTQHLFPPPEENAESAKPKRPDQELFDAFTEHFGPVRTKNERGRRNAAIGQLLEAGATVEELDIALEFCAKNFTQYSEGAVLNWFSRALHENAQQGDTRATFLRLIGGGGE